MTPESGWYPVALADDLEPGTSTGTRLFGRELVVWRDSAGQSHVWEDRCPHRGMRLSFGFVRGSHIACLYHGWQFDAEGRCRYIPAHPQLEVPATITVDRFSSTERLGIVWVYSGDAGTSGAPPGGNAEILPVRSLAVGAPADLIMAGLGARQSLMQSGDASIGERSAHLLTVRTEDGQFHVAVQPVTAQETTLHIVVEANPGIDPQRVSLWAEALRRDVEAKASEAGVAA